MVNRAAVKQYRQCSSYLPYGQHPRRNKRFILDPDHSLGSPFDHPSPRWILCPRALIPPTMLVTREADQPSKQRKYPTDQSISSATAADVLKSRIKSTCTNIAMNSNNRKMNRNEAMNRERAMNSDETMNSNGVINSEDSSNSRGLAPSNEILRYQSLLSQLTPSNAQEHTFSDADKEELRTAPLIWWNVKAHLDRDPTSANHLKQYAVLGNEVTESPVQKYVMPVLLNTNSPSSAFLCGSQGSGKSHTLSCMLENCLLQEPNLGKNPNPLAGLVLHYDWARGSGVCEAAYLCSKVKTTVLVSASNYGNLKHQYQEMAIKQVGTIAVKKLQISTKHLDTGRVKVLMAVSKEGETPLYIQCLMNLIREIAIEDGGVGTFDYRKFLYRLSKQKFSENQNQSLQLRLDLLEGFLDKPRSGVPPAPDYLVGAPGELTIIDLTDPVIDVDTACVLFDTCLSIFLSKTKGGKIVALDEAHNYLVDGSGAAKQFTGQLLKSIREQRHQGTRVVIATQEPTLDPKLLDLCSTVMVHRCTSPAWFDVLKKHLAGLYIDKTSDQEMFQKIVELRLGESLLFCPAAAMEVKDGVVGRMLDKFVKFRTRKRCTADGGRTRLAEETL